MKSRSKFKNGENRYEVYFAYEDYPGGTKFRSYDEMHEKGDFSDNDNDDGLLVGYLHSFYWRTTERISSLNLYGRPTISEVKAFMKECYDELDYDGKPNRYKLVKKWFIDWCNGEADEGERILGWYPDLKSAIAAMDKDVADVEEANCYQDEGYGGEDDTQTSERLSETHHYYDIADSCGSFVEWEIIKTE